MKKLFPKILCTPKISLIVTTLDRTYCHHTLLPIPTWVVKYNTRFGRCSRSSPQVLDEINNSYTHSRAVNIYGQTRIHKLYSPVCSAAKEHRFAKAGIICGRNERIIRLIFVCLPIIRLYGHHRVCPAWRLIHVRCPSSGKREKLRNRFINFFPPLPLTPVITCSFAVGTSS